MIYNIQNLIYILVICSILHFIFKKFKIFFIIQRDNHQYFTNKNLVPPVGGLYIFISLIIINLNSINSLYIYLFGILVIGILSDLKKLNSPIIRFYFQIILIVSYVYLEQIYLSSTRLVLLDNLLDIKIFNIIFVSFCILIVVNGTNFIDGLNGLALGYYILIILFILAQDLGVNFSLNQFLLREFLIILFLLVFFNYVNKIFIGDSGAYLLGFFISIYLIKLYIQNQFISPFFVILLLWYPCYENLFSILRKYTYRLSPINPDTRHLHQLVFQYINKKFKIKNVLINNNLSSVFINLYNFLFFLIGSQYITKTDVQIALILLNIFIYTYVYFQLSKIKK